MVVSLSATDNFLKTRVMNLPESVVAGTHNTEEGMCSWTVCTYKWYAITKCQLKLSLYSYTRDIIIIFIISLITSYAVSLRAEFFL